MQHALSDEQKALAFHHAISQARCLIWTAHVEERPDPSVDYTSPCFDPEKGTYLHWEIALFASENVQSWLPLAQEPGQSFTVILNNARFPQEQSEIDQRAITALREGHPSYSQSFRIRLADGTVCWLMENVQIRSVRPGVWELTGVCVDITERKRAEDHLRELMSRAHCLLWHAQVTAQPLADAPDWVTPTPLLQEHGVYLTWDIAFADDAIAERWLPLEHDNTDPFAVCYYWNRSDEVREQNDRISATALLTGERRYRQEFPVTLSDGSTRWVAEDVEIEVVRPGVWSLVGVVTDTTDLHQREEQLRFLARHDPVTGLPNRLGLMAALQAAAQQPVALLFLDLDNFKIINDSLGHPCGDLVLVEVAQRLRKAAQQAVAIVRLGGDEFTILLSGTSPDSLAPQARSLAEQVLRALSTPLHLEGRTLSLTASIGIVLGKGVDGDQLLRAADTAMYHTKNAGKASYTFFDTAMDRQAQQRFELEGELRQTLERQELLTFYQPIIRLSTQQTSHLEALVRWLHPIHGMIAPQQFLPIAEEAGLMAALGEQVLLRACQDAVRWGHRYPEIGVSVNVSPSQVQPELVTLVRHALAQSGLAPQLLTLEFTEQLFLQDTESCRTILLALAGLGVQLALDDFGSGYSSLGYLSRLPVQVLKIDRAFTSRIAGEGKEAQDNQAIVRSIVALGHSLNMVVTAEGVENLAQADLVAWLGCDQGQGYFWTHPRSYHDILRYLNQGTLRLAA